MITVTKPPGGPASLAAGAEQTALNCDLYDVDPGPYRDGRVKFKFFSSIYGSANVKNALKMTQHHKCCYCEAEFEANYAGDVDHYRPKGGVGSGRKGIKPGYYWLAYSWDNLYYACADCNQYRKRAAFPLADESKRALDHHANVNDEDPLILDPGGARDPRDHEMLGLSRITSAGSVICSSAATSALAKTSTAALPATPARESVPFNSPRL
jgi:uncharacterized protein (TIGR02646 family)